MQSTRDIVLAPVEPAATAFATLADVKALLGISGASEDARLTALMAAASALIEKYCGQYLAQRTVTETIDLEDTVSNFILAGYNIQSLTSISCNDVAQTVGDYRVLKMTGILRRTDGGTFEPAKWIVVYVAGYAAGTIPGPIAEAALQLTKALYNAKGVALGVKSESVDDVGSVTYGDATVKSSTGVALPVDVASLLGPYVMSFAP